MLWTAVAVVGIMAIIAIFFGKVIEESLFAEIAKWVVMTIGLVCIGEAFAYILAPLFWHIKYDGKDNEENLGMD